MAAINLGESLEKLYLGESLEKLFLGNFLGLREFLEGKTYEELKEMLMDIERRNEDGRILQKLMAGGEKKIYELPTEELVQILLTLIQHSSISSVEFWGAGMGLLESLICPRLQDLDIEHTVSDAKSWTGVGNSFMTVEKVTFEEHLDGDTVFPLVVISWLHSSHEHPILDALLRGQIQTLILVGEGPGMSCASDTFYLEVQVNGFQVTTVYGKQLCQTIYYQDNTVRPDDVCLSQVTIISKDERFKQEVVDELLSPDWLSVPEKPISEFSDQDRMALAMQDLGLQGQHPMMALLVALSGRM